MLDSDIRELIIKIAQAKSANPRTLDRGSNKTLAQLSLGAGVLSIIHFAYYNYSLIELVVASVIAGASGLFLALIYIENKRYAKAIGPFLRDEARLHLDHDIWVFEDGQFVQIGDKGIPTHISDI